MGLDVLGRHYVSYIILCCSTSYYKGNLGSVWGLDSAGA